MMLRKFDTYTGPVVRGIDLSTYQAPENAHGWREWPAWMRVARAQHADGSLLAEFAIARVAFGVSRDSTFEAHYQSAADVGIVPGAYLYFRPGQDPHEQGRRAVDVIGKHMRPGDLPPAIDIERAEGMDAHEIEERALVCIAEFEVLGRTPIVYAGAFVAEHVDAVRLSAFPLWTPDYAGEDKPCRIPRAWDGWTIRQVSGHGHVDGIVDAVDLDVFRGDRATFNAWRGAP